jgi:hypothetical protein
MLHAHDDSLGTHLQKVAVHQPFTQNTSELVKQATSRGQFLKRL